MTKTKVFFLSLLAPVFIFAALFGLPHLISILINSHTDVGLAAILVIACLLFSSIGTYIFNNATKELDNER